MNLLNSHLLTKSEGVMPKCFLNWRVITFCFLAAQGGCEPQLKGHIAGNYHVGNDKDMLIAVISSNLPFIGYPRTLNALNCIRSVEAEK